MANSERPAPEQVQKDRRWVNLLLGSGLLASIATFIYPAIRYMIPTEVAESTSRSVVAANINELKRNSGKIFKFGAKPALLVHTMDGEWKAFTAVCSHLNCTVQYREDLRQIWCACHNGIFDLQGSNVSGPPPRPLDAFQVHVQGEDVIVTRSS